MDFQRLIRWRNENNPFSRGLGVVIEEIRPGYARARKTVRPEDTNPMGRAQGGVYFTMADSVAGSAAHAHGRRAVTLDASWHFYRGSVPGDALTAEAVEVKAGKTICVYDVRLSDQEGRLLGSGSFTFFLLEEILEL